MKLYNQYRKYQQEGGDTPPGSSGGTPPTAPPSPKQPVDPSSPEIKAIVEQQVAALKAKNDELIGEKRKLTELIGDVDKDTLKNYIHRLKNDEESRLIAEGKIDEVVDRRTQRMKDAYQSKLDETTSKLTEQEKGFLALQERYNNTVIDNAIRDAAIKEGVVPSALDDVITRARRNFTVDGDRLVSKDPDTGDVRVGADGKTPYSPSDFIVDLKKQAPHFWPASAGGGYSPGNAPGSASDLQSVLQSKGFAAYKKARAGK